VQYLDLLLKHPDATLVIYVLRQMKHLKYTSETLEKTPEKYFKPLQTYATFR
jgi:hypothetical protein